MHQRGRTAAAAIACALALLGCDEGATPSAGPTEQSGTLLDVSGRTLDGGEMDLATLHGDQVVLWMWAPW